MAPFFSNSGWTQIPGRKNRQKALDEVHRILKAGGTFIFTAHIRQIRGFTLFWTKQWIKLFILKPLGFKIDEIEFGDRFFERSSKGTPFLKQYIHIPSAKRVLKQIKYAGFKLIYMECHSTISDKNPMKFSPMFYVCKK